MNLLDFHKRFDINAPYSPVVVLEMTGYLNAMNDMLTLVKIQTEFFDPTKRFIDAAEITKAIADTTEAMRPHLERAKNKLKDSFNPN